MKLLTAALAILALAGCAHENYTPEQQATLSQFMLSGGFTQYQFHPVAAPVPQFYEPPVAQRAPSYNCTTAGNQTMCDGF